MGRWLVGLLLGFPLSGGAQLPETVEHPPLAVSASLDRAAVLAAAVAHAPELRATEGAQSRAEVYDALANRLTVGRPQWDGVFLDDGPLTNAGLYEAEAGVQVNLWRPGQRAQARDLGGAAATVVPAQAEAITLDVAGRVRNALADLQQAESLLALERQILEDTRQLLEVTRTQFAAGSVSELDVLQVETLELAQQYTVLEAEAGLVDAELAYRVLTGLEVRPAQILPESRSPQTAVPTDHPQLAWLRARIDLARQEVDRARRDAAGSPSLRLGVRRERGGFAQPVIDTLGISVSVPFGGRQTVAAGSLDARNAQLALEIEWEQTRRALDAQLHEAAHGLEVAEAALGLQQRQSEIAARQWDMARTAFAVGEVTLNQVILALQQARRGESAFLLAEQSVHRLTGEYNQVIGELP